MFNKQKEKFALRKLTVGLASVLIGISFISAQNCEVKADTINDTETARTTSDQTTTQPVQDANVVQETPAENKQTDSADVTTPAKIVQETTSQMTTTPEKQETNQTKTMDANKQNFEPKQLSPENKQDAISENVKQAGANRKTAMLYTVKKRTAMIASMTNVSKIGETTAIRDYTPDVKSWKGQVVSNKDLDGITRTYYELTGYTPNSDAEKTTIIIPNQDDFTKAGINIGYQTMIKSDTIKNLNKTLKPEE